MMPSVIFLDLIGTVALPRTVLHLLVVGYRVNPRPDPAKRHEERERAQKIPLKKCKKDRPWCGYSGRDVPYNHDPMTSIQKWCRREPSKDLQQYTRTYEPIKVERSVSDVFTK